MKYPTALDGPGLFNLERVQLFFQKMKVDLSKVIINQKYFELNNPQLNAYKQFYAFVQQTKLCPVIAADHIVTDSCHAMVVDKAIQHGTDWYFQCKNTYKSNPKALVGHINLRSWFQSIEYKPYDAICISFDKK